MHVTHIKHTPVRTQTSVVGRARRESIGLILKLCETGPKAKTCQWIHGDPTKSDYRSYGPDSFKCGLPIKPKSPYCEHHHSVCHQKPVEPTPENP